MYVFKSSFFAAKGDKKGALHTFTMHFFKPNYKDLIVQQHQRRELYNSHTYFLILSDEALH